MSKTKYNEDNLKVARLKNKIDKVYKCPSCKNEDEASYFISVRKTTKIGKVNYDVFECNRCQLLFKVFYGKRK